MEVIRTSPYRYQAITYDGTNEQAIQTFVTQYPTGSIVYATDNNAPVVEVSKDPQGFVATHTLDVGDTIFKEQGNEFFTVVSDIGSSTDYDVI